MREPRSVVPTAAGPRTETEGRKRRGPVVSNCSLRCTRTYMLAHLNRPRIAAQLGVEGSGHAQHTRRGGEDNVRFLFHFSLLWLLISKQSLPPCSRCALDHHDPDAASC